MDRFAKPFAEQRDDLTDLDNLFRGGQNEGGKTFPRVLPQKPQSATTGDGFVHRLVVRKSFQHGGQINFRLEKFTEKIPIRNWRGSFGVNAVGCLGQADEMFSDDHTSELQSRQYL